MRSFALQSCYSLFFLGRMSSAASHQQVSCPSMRAQKTERCPRRLVPNDHRSSHRVATVVAPAVPLRDFHARVGVTRRKTVAGHTTCLSTLPPPSCSEREHMCWWPTRKPSVSKNASVLVGRARPSCASHVQTAHDDPRASCAPLPPQPPGTSPDANLVDGGSTRCGTDGRAADICQPPSAPDPDLPRRLCWVHPTDEAHPWGGPTPERGPPGGMNAPQMPEAWLVW